MTVALVARRLHVIIIWLWFPDKFHIGLVYLDNVIFHGRLSDRNYWCRRRPRYLIFSQFSIYCCQNAFASGALPRTPPGGFQLPQLANVGSHHCRGPHRIAGPRAPRPHDPPLVGGCQKAERILFSLQRFSHPPSQINLFGSMQNDPNFKHAFEDTRMSLAVRC